MILLKFITIYSYNVFYSILELKTSKEKLKSSGEKVSVLETTVQTLQEENVGKL